MSVQSILICCVEPVTTFTMTITQKQQQQQTFTCNGVVPNALLIIIHLCYPYVVLCLNCTCNGAVPNDLAIVISQDEPTNNLNLESIDVLSEAINEFTGGMFVYMTVRVCVPFVYMYVCVCMCVCIPYSR